MNCVVTSVESKLEGMKNINLELRQLLVYKSLCWFICLLVFYIIYLASVR